MEIKCANCGRVVKTRKHTQKYCSISCGVKAMWDAGHPYWGGRLPEEVKKEKALAYQRQWYKDNKEKAKEYNKEWRQKNRGKITAQRKERRANDPAYREKENAAQRRRVQKRLKDLREEIFIHYSNGEIKCACCGETERKFLSIDHIRPVKHHLKNYDHGTNLYLRLKREGFPIGYQVLCYNCNIAKGIYGVCPHREV